MDLIDLANSSGRDTVIRIQLHVANPGYSEMIFILQCTYYGLFSGRYPEDVDEIQLFLTCY